MSQFELEELRRVLTQASEMAEALGDEPPEPVAEGRYLGSDAILEAIDSVSEHDGDLTVIVGAGASMEAGLPSWPQLITRLLRGVSSSQFQEAVRDQWVELMVGESPTTAAAVVEALSTTPEDYVDRVRAALYGGRPTTSYAPQALAQQIAWMKDRLGDTVRLATGNFDGLLETALEDLGLEVHSYVQSRSEPPGSAAVYHLHGRLIPAYPRTGRIVLSDADYARVQQERSWQDAFMRDALETTLCVFVGASMTDPNLIRWLYRYSDLGASHQHVAIFARQSTPRLSAQIRDAVEVATEARWARCGVAAVFADFFGEVAQFLHEVTLRRSGSSLPAFAARARDRHNIGRELVIPDDPSQFRVAQEQTSAFLATLLRGAESIAHAGGLDLSAEQLGLGLWGVDHDTGKAAVWATSDRRLNDLGAVVDNPLEFESRWMAIQAITRGVAVENDPRVYASRWRFIRGVPLVLPIGGGAGRTVCGVLTLTSMTPQAESQLTRSRAVSSIIDDYLGRAGARLFA